MYSLALDIAGDFSPWYSTYIVFELTTLLCGSTVPKGVRIDLVWSRAV